MASTSPFRLSSLPVELLRAIFDKAFIPDNANDICTSAGPDDYTRTLIGISTDAHFPPNLRRVAHEMQHKHTWLSTWDGVAKTTDVLRTEPHLAGSVRQLFLYEEALSMRATDPQQRYARCDAPETADEEARIAALARHLRQTLPASHRRPASCRFAMEWARSMVHAIDLLSTLPALHDLTCFAGGLALLPTTADFPRGRLVLRALRSLCLLDEPRAVHEVQDTGRPMGVLDMRSAVLHAAPNLQTLHLAGFERVTYSDGDDAMPLPYFPHLRSLTLTYCPLDPLGLRSVLALVGTNLTTAHINVPRLLTAPDDDPQFEEALRSGAHFAFSLEDVLQLLAPWKDSTLTTLELGLRVPRGETPRFQLSGVTEPGFHLTGLPDAAGDAEFNNPRQRPAMALLPTFSALRHLSISVDLFDWSIEQWPDVFEDYQSMLEITGGQGTTAANFEDMCYGHVAANLVHNSLPRDLETLTFTLPAGYQGPNPPYGLASHKLTLLGEAVFRALGFGDLPNLRALTVITCARDDGSNRSDNSDSSDDSDGANSSIRVIDRMRYDEAGNVVPTGETRLLTVVWI